MKNPFLLLLLSFLFFAPPQKASSQFLKVSANHKHLEKSDGTPFFYLGDTAWELFHRLSLEEAKEYLRDRSQKGFTVIQAVVLAQLGGIEVANANGDLPLQDGDPAKPLEPYFKHVDAVVDLAASLDLHIGMLPCWGSYWSTTNGDRKIFNATNAFNFGKYLGQRYGNRSVIWIMGGDENINNQEERQIIEAMASGIRSEDENNLMTFHPRGPGRSSDYFHTSDWLDFNMYQSSHAGHDHDNGLYAEHDLSLSPQKPTLDGEPRYELIPAGFYFKEASRLDLFTDYDARQAAYWSVLAGACGHTYGHNSIWQMYDQGREPVIGAKVPWHEAIQDPGSRQMGHLKKLFVARPFHRLVPNQEMIVSGPSHGGAKIRASVSEDGAYAIIYSPRGEAFTLDQSAIKARGIRSIWYDPRYGISHVVHSGNTFAIQTYQPPTQGKGHDWILILEDPAKNYQLP